jgi:hypothetical protein
VLLLLQSALEKFAAFPEKFPEKLLEKSQEIPEKFLEKYATASVRQIDSQCATVNLRNV